MSKDLAGVIFIVSFFEIIGKVLIAVSGGLETKKAFIWWTIPGSVLLTTIGVLGWNLCTSHNPLKMLKRFRKYFNSLK